MAIFKLNKQSALHGALWAGLRGGMNNNYVLINHIHFISIIVINIDRRNLGSISTALV